MTQLEPLHRLWADSGCSPAGQEESRHRSREVERWLPRRIGHSCTLSRRMERTPCRHPPRAQDGDILRSHAAALPGGSRERRGEDRLRGERPAVPHHRSGRRLGPACQGGSRPAGRTSREGRMTISEPLIALTAYCRTSTDDQQNPEESLRWQLSRASALIVGTGGDRVGHPRHRRLPVRSLAPASRSGPTHRSNSPTRLGAGPGSSSASRSEPSGRRAKCRTSCRSSHTGASSSGCPKSVVPVDPESEAHDLLMSLFGGLSKAERNRLRVRVRTSMKAMAPEGRYLGGRPPYGYRLVRTGVPHPNPEKARQGIELTNLAVDPETSKVVQQIFAWRVEGVGFRTIAARLSEQGIPLPLGGRPGAKPAPSRPSLVAWRGPGHRHEPEVQGAGHLWALPQGRTPLRRE